MRALVTAAVIAATLLFSPVAAQAQKTTQTWYRVEGPAPHWVTTFDLGWGTVYFDAIFIPDHGVTYTVRVPCTNNAGTTAIHVYGVGMIDGVWLDCFGVLAKTERNLNFWLMLVGELPREIVGSLSQRNIDGFGPPPTILD
jgi:hypothetical protein